MSMKHFFVGVKGIVRDGDKLLLMHDQRGGKDYWDIPGGRMDDDEAVLETLERELHEELPNIQSYDIGKLLHVYRLHKDIQGDVSLVLLFYELKNVTFIGKPQVSEEHTEAQWFSLEEAKRNGVDSIQEALQKLV